MDAPADREVVVGLSWAAALWGRGVAQLRAAEARRALQVHLAARVVHHDEALHLPGSP